MSEESAVKNSLALLLTRSACRQSLLEALEAGMNDQVQKDSHKASLQAELTDGQRVLFVFFSINKTQPCCADAAHRTILVRTLDFRTS